MIQKIKDLMNVKEDIEIVNKAVEENTRLTNELKAELNELTSQLKDIKSNQAEFLGTFKEDLKTINNLKEEFANELYEFKLLKGQLQRKILDKFEEELVKDLQVNRETLKKDIEDYNELKGKVNEILSRINVSSEEVNKFVDISKNIKKEDFELTRFARHLIEMDREKLDLMRKIDTLERLVSKIRRREIVR